MIREDITGIETIGDEMNYSVIQIEKNRKKKIKVAEPATMNKYFFDHYRLLLFRHLKGALHSKELDHLVSAKVLNRKITKENVSFDHLTFWRIDRFDFYVDVDLTLRLDTVPGIVTWKGYISLWFNAEEKFTCTVDDFGPVEAKPSREDMAVLNSFLIPVLSNHEMDKLAEEIWITYNIPGALDQPKLRNALKLAEKMGLSIQYLPIHKTNMDSVLVLKETEFQIKEKKKEDDGVEPEIVVVPANTIVVNTNLVARENSDYNIFHECVHAEWHYLFFMLQDMSDGDVAKMKMKEVEVEKDQDIDDPVHFLEIQANRGAYGLMMPVTNTRALFNEEIGKVSKYRHNGELLQIAGRAVINKLDLPYFRVRARMVQLGHADARGALNKVDREWIEPFAFDQEAWTQDKYTFIVSKYTVGVLYEKNADFQKLLDSRYFVYCDGHVVRNEPRFMRDGPNGKLLSLWANEHVDKCCLRFIRRYVPKYRGEYEHGKLYYDADYVKQTEFYLGDLLNSENVNEIQAEKQYT